MGSNTINNMKIKITLLFALILLGVGVKAQVGVAAADTSLRATVNGQVRIWKNFEYYKTAFGLYYNKVQIDGLFGANDLQSVLIRGNTASTNILIGNSSGNVLGYGLFNGSGFYGNTIITRLNLASSGLNNLIEQNSGAGIIRTVGGSTVNTFYPDGRISGTDATSNADLTTLQQVNSKIAAIPTPTLQSVTDLGNTTSNSVSIGQTVDKVDTLIFIGDSIDKGYGLQDTLTRHTTVLANRLNAVEINKSVTGMSMQNGSPTSYGGSILTQLALIPNYIKGNNFLIISLGTNDILINSGSYTVSGFKSAYVTIINNALSKGWASSKIILTSPPFISNYSYSTPYVSSLARHQAYVQATKETALNYSLKYIDLLDITTKNGGVKLLQADGVHPNVLGNKIIASAEYSAFNSLEIYGDADITGVLSASYIKNNPSHYSVNRTTSATINEYIEIGYLSYSKNISDFIDITLNGTDTLSKVPIFSGFGYNPTARTYKVPINSWYPANTWVNVRPLLLTGLSAGWEVYYQQSIMLQVKLVTPSFGDSRFYFRIINLKSGFSQSLNINVSLIGKPYSSYFTPTAGKGTDAGSYAYIGASTHSIVSNGNLSENYQIFPTTYLYSVPSNTDGLYKIPVINTSATTNLGLIESINSLPTAMGGTGGTTGAVLNQTSLQTANFNVSGTGGVGGNFTGGASITSASTLSSNNGTLVLRNSASTTRQILFQTNAARRFTLGVTSTPESGANAGSDFSGTRYDDAGNSLGDWLVVNRANGRISLGPLTSINVMGTVTASGNVFVPSKPNGLSTDSLVTSNPTTGVLQRISGSVNYIQNQNATTQTGQIKINGSVVASDFQSTGANGYVATAGGSSTSIMGNGISVFGDGSGGYSAVKRAGLEYQATGSSFKQYLNFAPVTGSNKTVTLPDVSGTVAVLEGSDPIKLINFGTGGSIKGVSGGGSVSIPAGKIGVIAITSDIYDQILTQTGQIIRKTASGNGTSTTISIPHGVTGITSTSICLVTANTAAAAGFQYVTTDATNINIIYTVAPVTGTNNLVYSIQLK